MSFKLESRLITLVAGLITVLSVLDISAWEVILPRRYIVLAPAIVAGIGFIASQLSEETRVTHAVDKVHERYKSCEAQTEEEVIETNDYIEGA